MKILFFVDRISEGIATLLYNDGEFTATLPAEILPPGTSEGDWLSAEFKIDRDARSRARDDIDSLMDELEK